MSSFALSDSFEYLWYGSTAIKNIFTLPVQGANLDVRIWRLETQIMSTKVDPRTVRVNVGPPCATLAHIQCGAKHDT